MAAMVTPFFDVCVLSHGNWDETNRALQSAWRFGLNVHLGVTVDAVCPLSGPLLTVYSCPWPGDFSAVRNSLLDKVKSEKPYLLWTDSDEEILCCPAIPPLDLSAPLYAVKISVQAGVTASKRATLHRNEPDIRWLGSVHEFLGKLSGDPIPYPKVMRGLAILHHGYEDNARVLAKLSRNSDIANRAIAKGSVHPGATASIARERVALGRATAFDWLAVYRTSERLARAQGYSRDQCWEAAASLAYCGYTYPAEQLTMENALNIPLQLSLLIAHHARTGSPEPIRFDFVLTCLQRILWDDRFPFDSSLIGTAREELADHIADQARGLGWHRSATLHDKRKADMTENKVFIQTRDILLETFEEDILLLSPQTNRVVSLNASGKVFWDAMESGTSVMDCATMLAEASGSPITPELLAHIGGFFQELLDSGMIQSA